MDDFLHNLRSGKLKQPERARRDYTDYKGPQRRAGNERRRTDYYAKVTGENFALVKDALDSLAEQQKRIADALETIAAKLGFSSEDAESQASSRSTVAEESPESVPGDDDWSFSGSRLDDQDRPRLIELIDAMRQDGQSWEKIARHMSTMSVPTLSGKGTWRGTAVKKFWDTDA